MKYLRLAYEAEETFKTMQREYCRDAQSARALRVE
jgi:hypothetical protein